MCKSIKLLKANEIMNGISERSIGDLDKIQEVLLSNLKLYNFTPEELISISDEKLLEYDDIVYLSAWGEISRNKLKKIDKRIANFFDKTHKCNSLLVDETSNCIHCIFGKKISGLNAEDGFYATTAVVACPFVNSRLDYSCLNIQIDMEYASANYLLVVSLKRLCEILYTKRKRSRSSPYLKLI